MKPIWSTVPLGEVLKISLDAEPVDAASSYNIAGVYSFGRGLFKREPLSGSDTTYKVFHRLHKDSLVISKLKAWEGAIARVTKDYEGWFLSPQFTTFDIFADRIDVRYLEWYCRRSLLWEELRLISRGMGARRDSVHPKRFLSIKIPLPPLAEQRRIVAKIETLAAKITSAQKLRKQSVEETFGLMNTAGRVILGKANRTIEDVAFVTKLAGFEYTKYFIYAGPGDVIVLRAGNVRNSGLSLGNAMTIPVTVSDSLPRSQLKSGDVVMTFIGAKIGDVSYIRNDHPRLHCGPNVAKITPNQEVDHLYLVKVLQSGFVQDQIANITKRAAQPSLSMKVIRQIQIPVPSMEEQRRIVAYLDGLQAQVDALKKLQTQTAAELDALLPAILDRAFKGEL